MHRLKGVSRGRNGKLNHGVVLFGTYEFYRPSGVDRPIRPPRSPREVVLHDVLLPIGHDRLHHRVVTALDALNEFQAVGDEPGRGYAPAASDVKDGFDSQMCDLRIAFGEEGWGVGEDVSSEMIRLLRVVISYLP